MIAAASGEAATSFVLEKLLDAPPRETGKAVFELNKRRAPKGKNVITWTLENGRILKAYIELTGENPEKEAWWTNWTTSRRERHDIVHDGKITADASLAMRCIAAADMYIEHLITVVKQAAGREPRKE